MFDSCWCGWDKKRVVVVLVENIITTTTTTNNNNNNKHVLDKATIERASVEWRRILSNTMARANACQAESTQRSLRDGLAEECPEAFGFQGEASNDVFHRLIRAFAEKVEHYEGASLSSLSLLDWDSGGEYAGFNSTVPLGYGTFISSLVEPDYMDFVFLNTVVTRIEWDQDLQR